MDDGAGAHREAESLGFLVEVCDRTSGCSRAEVRVPLGPPRGAIQLGQLQDHYHQNDDDQDPDDEADNSSVHFASSIRTLTQFGSGRWTRPVADVEVRAAGASAVRPDSLLLQLNHPKGGCITPLGRLLCLLWKLR